MSARFIFSFLSVLATTAVLAAARPHWTTDAPASYSSHTVVATKTTTVGVTTIVSATTVVPVTTVFPVTTVVPVTTVIPVTSVVPITSSVPVTVTTTTTVAPVPVTTTVVVTSPPATTTVGGTSGQCSTGPVQCCKFVQFATSSKASALLGLLGIVLSSLDVPVGMDCSPLNVLGSGPSCSAQTVCCQNNNFNGLVAIGCTPININL